jgi:hypothetical protein
MNDINVVKPCCLINLQIFVSICYHLKSTLKERPSEIFPIELEAQKGNELSQHL